VELSIQIKVHDDGSWSYEQDSVLKMHGHAEFFHHIARNWLRRVGAPTPNWLLRREVAARPGG
jgi:hypothetical protein